MTYRNQFDQLYRPMPSTQCICSGWPDPDKWVIGCTEEGAAWGQSMWLPSRYDTEAAAEEALRAHAAAHGWKEVVAQA